MNKNSLFCIKIGTEKVLTLTGASSTKEGTNLSRKREENGTVNHLEFLVPI